MFGRTQIVGSFVYLLEMRNRPEPKLPAAEAKRLLELPRPTPAFRRRAWLDFQRALDPLAPPMPLRRGLL
ncbi:MAG: hypothetical protein H0V79_07620 [Actinobacteria bacterium]|nr:hypothetical protein [Actinomycetota bacterium]